MFRLARKGLWAHKVRFALTALAVVCGVAFMTGTRILTDTMSRTFDEVFTTANDGIDVVVQQPEAIDGDVADVRERVPAELVARVRAVDGVADVAGTVQGFAQLVGADGEVEAPNGLGATIGANWVDGPLNPFQIATGRAPHGPNEVVLDKATADDEGVALGDTVTVLGKGDPRAMTVVGTARYGTVDGIPGSSLVAVDDATAQELFGEPGAYDAIVVRAADGVSPDTLAARVGAEMGGGLEVLTGAQDTATKQDELRDDLSFFTTFLMAFALIALFVGMFLIANTYSIVVAQRTRELAVLRAIGAGRAQVRRAVLAEALAVGVFASGAGLGAGVGLSFALRQLLSAVGLDVPSDGLVIGTGTIVTGFVMGVAVTVLSAWGPARRAGRVAPMAALRESSVEQVGVRPGRTLAGLAVTAAGAATFAAGSVADDTGTAVQLLGLGALATVVGVLALGPAVVGPLARLLGVVPRLVSGTAGRLATENARRNPKRSAATAAALMVGVALVGFISILAASTKDSIAAAIDRSLRADYVVDSGSWGEGGFSPVLAARLDALDEVAVATPVRTSPARVDGHTTLLLGVDTGRFGQVYDIDVTEGSLGDVRGPAVAVRASVAEEQGLGVGDTVQVTFGRTGTVPMTVAALYDVVLPGGGEWLVDLDTFEANVSDQYDAKVFVATADGVDPAAAEAAIEGALAGWANAELEDQAAFAEAVTAEVDMILNLVYGLLGLAVLIALLGIVNTLALSVHERTRELGLLRAVGMGRRQVRASVRWEALLLSLVGVALGTALAVGGAYGIVTALAGEGIDTFTVPVARLWVVVAIAAAASLLAAAAPARRAARLDVLAAIAQ